MLGEDVPHVEFVRVAYDLNATIAGVRAAGLPEDFVEFLRTGGKPSPAGLGAGPRLAIFPSP